MKILVTGCAGFIGFHLTKKFLSKNIKVCGIDNLNTYYDIRIKKDRLKLLLSKHKENFKFFKVDLTHDKSVKRIFKKEKFDIVINLAAQAGVRFSIKNPQAYVDSNLIGFFNVLNNVKIFKVKHFLFASSSSVYGDQKKMPILENYSITKPIQFYAATKVANEVMAHSYSHLFNIKSSALRFFTVYGPWGRPDMALFKFTKNILENQPIEIFNKGDHERDFTYIDDCVEAVSKIALSKIKRQRFEVFNIANGKSEKLQKYIKYIELELGLIAKRKYLPLQSGDIRKTSANINKIKRMFYFRSKTNISDGVKKFVRWYKDYYKVK
jgi:UDP-glucuronate 4-epimerase